MKYEHTKDVTIDGKRYKFRAHTEAELAVKVAMKQRDIEENKIIITKNTTVDGWAKEYLATYREPHMSAESYKTITSYHNRFISPVIGDIRLKDVRATHCQRIANSLQGYSFSQGAKVLQLLKGVFSTAVENELLTVSPAANAIMPKLESGTHRALTDGEKQLFLKVCETHKYGLWGMTLYYCGLRPGETERIKGRHIDIKKMRLYVDGTKSKAAKRYVPIHPLLAEKFKNAGTEPFRSVFVNGNGETINKTNRKRMWIALVRAMNIEAGCKVINNAVVPPYWVADDFVPYCLRHNFCTELQAAGVPINVAREFMGHSDISMTSKIYTHHSEEAFSGAAEMMSRYHDSKQKMSHPMSHPKREKEG